MVSPKFLRLWQPKELLRGNLFRTPPPDQLDSRYAKKCLMVKANPARLLKLYELYAKKSDSVDSRFLVRVFCILAQTVAHPNCFFTTADRQRIVSGTAAGSSSANSSFGSGQSAAATSNNLVFRKLCSDIAELQAEIRAKEVPQILFSMALLEYRFWQIGERLLCSVEENLHVYRFETLATVIWAMAKLDLGGVRTTGRGGCTTAGAAATASMTTSEIEDRMDAGTVFGPYPVAPSSGFPTSTRYASASAAARASEVDGREKLLHSRRDFAGLFPRLLDEVAKFLPPETEEAISAEESQFWAQIMFSCVLMQHWDRNLPLFMRSGCRGIADREQLDACGWQGYFIYQTLYCLDVLKPEACPTAMGTKEYRDYVNAGAFTPKRIQLGLDSACFAEQKAEVAKEISRECTAGKKRREQRGRRRKEESAETDPTEADREPEDEGEESAEATTSGDQRDEEREAGSFRRHGRKSRLSSRRRFCSRSVNISESEQPEGAEDPHSDADAAPAAEPDDNHPRQNESRRRQHMEDDENDHEEQADVHPLRDDLDVADPPRRNIEIETKMACPMWIQERLHEFWLDGTLLKAQPQGADELQLDVERALNRTHTKASINTSLGRPHDEQHCFFAGHFLRPNIALEYDSHSCMGPDRVRAGGMVSLKQKLFAKFGVRTATIHRTFWDRLTADEKDEQVTRLRVAMGYRAMAKSGAPGDHQGEDQQKEGRTGKWDCEYARKEGFGSAGFGRSRTGRKSGTTLGLAHVTVPDNDPNRAGAIKKTETERKVSIRGGKFREKRREKLT